MVQHQFFWSYRLLHLHGSSNSAFHWHLQMIQYLVTSTLKALRHNAGNDAHGCSLTKRQAADPTTAVSLGSPAGGRVVLLPKCLLQVTGSAQAGRQLAVLGEGCWQLTAASWAVDPAQRHTTPLSKHTLECFKSLTGACISLKAFAVCTTQTLLAWHHLAPGQSPWRRTISHQCRCALLKHHCSGQLKLRRRTVKGNWFGCLLEEPGTHWGACHPRRRLCEDCPWPGGRHAFHKDRCSGQIEGSGLAWSDGDPHCAESLRPSRSDLHSVFGSGFKASGASLSSTLVVGIPPTVATAAAALSPGPPSLSSLPEATLFSPGRSFEALAALASFSGLVRRRPCMLNCSSTAAAVAKTRQAELLGSGHPLVMAGPEPVMSCNMAALEHSCGKCPSHRLNADSQREQARGWGWLPNQGTASWWPPDPPPVASLQAQGALERGIGVSCCRDGLAQLLQQGKFCFSSPSSGSDPAGTAEYFGEEHVHMLMLQAQTPCGRKPEPASSSVHPLAPWDVTLEVLLMMCCMNTKSLKRVRRGAPWTMRRPQKTTRHLKSLRASSSLPVMTQSCRRQPLALPSLAASVQPCPACTKMYCDELM
eukprot:jgi/Astpho2/6493/fgenesh1_pg.00096_%23_24_t